MNRQTGRKPFHYPPYYSNGILIPGAEGVYTEWEENEDGTCDVYGMEVFAYHMHPDSFPQNKKSWIEHANNRPDNET